VNEEKFLLKQLIFHYENDLENASEEYVPNVKEVRMNFDLLIRSVTKLVNDFRYCRKVNCPCSPESDIEHVYPHLKDYLKKTKTALYPIPYKTIEKIIWGLKNDCK